MPYTLLAFLMNGWAIGTAQDSYTSRRWRCARGFRIRRCCGTYGPISRGRGRICFHKGPGPLLQQAGSVGEGVSCVPEGQSEVSGPSSHSLMLKPGDDFSISEWGGSTLRKTDRMRTRFGQVSRLTLCLLCGVRV